MNAGPPQSTPSLRVVTASEAKAIDNPGSAGVRSTPNSGVRRSIDDEPKPIFTAKALTHSVLAKRELRAKDAPDAAPVKAVPAPQPLPNPPQPSLRPARVTERVAEPPNQGLVPRSEEKTFTLSWTPLSGDLDARIIEACTSTSDGRSVHAAFSEKEVQLGTMFAALSLSDARLLHRRLTIPAKDDPVATAFTRLNAERRDRLVAFLADARRRAALARTSKS